MEPLNKPGDVNCGETSPGKTLWMKPGDASIYMTRLREALRVQQEVVKVLEVNSEGKQLESKMCECGHEKGWHGNAGKSFCRHEFCSCDFFGLKSSKSEQIGYERLLAEKNSLLRQRKGVPEMGEQLSEMCECGHDRDRHLNLRGDLNEDIYCWDCSCRLFKPKAQASESKSTGGSLLERIAELCSGDKSDSMSPSLYRREVEQTLFSPELKAALQNYEMQKQRADEAWDVINYIKEIDTVQYIVNCEKLDPADAAIDIVKRLRDRMVIAENNLSTLLAVIFRDGGHKQQEINNDGKAVALATVEISDLRSQLDSSRAERFEILRLKGCEQAWYEVYEKLCQIGLQDGESGCERALNTITDLCNRLESAKAANADVRSQLENQIKMHQVCVANHQEVSRQLESTKAANRETREKLAATEDAFNTLQTRPDFKQVVKTLSRVREENIRNLDIITQQNATIAKERERHEKEERELQEKLAKVVADTSNKFTFTQGLIQHFHDQRLKDKQLSVALEQRDRLLAALQTIESHYDNFDSTEPNHQRYGAGINYCILKLRAAIDPPKENRND